jgi:hypothetical protein
VRGRPQKSFTIRSSSLCADREVAAATYAGMALAAPWAWSMAVGVRMGIGGPSKGEACMSLVFGNVCQCGGRQHQ